jgi:hypothetical protein
MPQDRVADSYVINSQLLPGDEIEWGKVQRSFWLMEDTTRAEPPDSPCATGGMMNPHKAIHAPEPRQTDFGEALADFDAHCHDRYLIDASQFHAKLPVRLLDEEARKRYVSHVAGYMPPQNNIMQAPPTPDEFKGAAGMHSFYGRLLQPCAHFGDDRNRHVLRRSMRKLALGRVGTQERAVADLTVGKDVDDVLNLH